MRILAAIVVTLTICACTAIQDAPVIEDQPATARENAESVLLRWIDRLPHALEIGADKLSPSIEKAAAFQTALEALITDDLSLAAAAAELAGYRVTVFKFGESRFTALVDSQYPGIGPTIIVNMQATRELIAGAPHPVFEEGVDVEAGLFLTRLGARAAIIAGAHACASSIASQCSGADYICARTGSLQLRLSDAAHSTILLYQLALETMASEWPDSIFFNLRGMQQTDTASAIFSNGSNTLAGPEELANRLRTSVKAVWPDSAAYVFSCQDADNDFRNYRSSCGTGNVQGRFLNGSPDACTVAATESGGRFINLEQGDKILDSFESSAQLKLSASPAEKLLRGIAAVIPSSERKTTTQGKTSAHGQGNQ